MILENMNKQKTAVYEEKLKLFAKKLNYDVDSEQINKANQFLQKNANTSPQELFARIKTRDLQSNSDIYLYPSDKQKELEIKGIAYLSSLNDFQQEGLEPHIFLDEIRKNTPEILQNTTYKQIHCELDKVLATKTELEAQYEQSGMYNYFFDHFGIDTLLTENIHFKLQTMDLHEVALIGRKHRFDKLDGDVEVYTRIETGKHYEELLPFQIPTIPILNENKMSKTTTLSTQYRNKPHINKIFETQPGSKPNLMARCKTLTNIFYDAGYFYLD